MPGRDRLHTLLRGSTALLVVLIVGGTLLTKAFMAAYEGVPVSWGQALVYVLQTVTTVGYGELVPDGGFESIQMTVLAIVLMVVGVSLVFLVGATLAAQWIEARIAPRAPTSTRLEDHIIITDWSSLVQDLVREMDRRGHPCLLVGEDEETALDLDEQGYEVVLGSPDELGTLEAAGVDRARGVLAAGSDAENIGVALAARSGGDLPIVALVESPENMRFPALAGADAVVSPKVAMGRGLVDWTLAVPTPADWPPPIRVEEGAEVVRELHPSVFYITPGSPLSELTVADVGQRTRALIVGLWRGEELDLNPDPREPVLDTAIVAVGDREDVRELAQLASEGDGHGRVVLAGYGTVGQVAYRRLRDAGADVTVVDLEERDVEGQVVGDATKLGVLREAGVDDARMLVLALGDDNLNLQVALEAQAINPRIHISARAHSDEAQRKYGWAGIDHPLSMATVSARMLMQALVREGALEPPFEHVAARRPAGSLEGSELRAGDIRQRTGCLVMGIVEDGACRPAHGGEVVGEGAELVLLGRPDELAAYERLFEDA